MQVSVINTSGSETGRTVTLNESIFNAEPNQHAIWLDVKQFLANQRQGTHKTKERAEIARTTKKLKRQKGTGGARAGSMKSPLFRGGGRVFGPQPRDYSFKLNKKLKRLARVSALSSKAKNGGILVLEDFNYSAPKTKDFAGMLNKLSVTEKKSLLVLSETNKNIYLSSRNLQHHKVVTASSLNTYDIMNAQKIILSEKSLAVIEQILA
ncbi:MAG: 50S ribosomal protein L4 [Bacteroidetes bacterium]|nr:50S ribosomal protein L4 [Bacteroidota bacterium]MBL0051077.1 50S ribosomal protein L4 [Bacteroidota bacterium]